MENNNILIIIFGIITSLILIVVFFINRIYFKKEKVDFLFENVKKYVDERVDLFLRVHNFIKTSTENETKLLKEIEKQEEILSSIKKTSAETLKNIKNSFKINEKVSKLYDIYPKFQNNNIYQVINQELELNKDRILYAIDTYDKEAKKYNQFKSTKINKKISKILKLKDYDYYEE